MRCYVLPSDGKARAAEVDDDLRECYTLIGCQCIDVAHVCDGVIAIVDDEGWLTDQPTATVFDGSLAPWLAGTVVFVGDDGPEFRGLTDGEIEYLRSRTYELYCGGGVVRDIMVTY